MEFQLNVLLRNYPLLLSGLLLTLAIALIALVIGVALGGLLCAARLSKRRPLNRLAGAYILFFRVTPEMILIFWAYFCIPLLLGWRISGLWAGSVTLGLVAAAYYAEIFRAGIQALPKGQAEAARSLGMRGIPLWRFVLLPQALRLMVPPLVNYFTELLKNTTLLSAIGIGELALQAYLLGGQTFRYVEFLTAIAFIYFFLIFPLSLASRRLEHGSGRG